MDNSMKIVFLILNYETYWETFQCVESIFQMLGIELFKDKKASIVIVDNGSKNDSFSKLEHEYGSKDYIYLIRSDVNLGFARGNNLGFIFVKEKLSPDFVVMINSDIIMTDNNFVSKLFDEYAKHQFDIAGPDVTLVSGEHLNPCYCNRLDIVSVDNEIKKMKRKIWLCKIHVEPFVAAFFRLKKLFVRKKDVDNVENAELELSKGMQIHGCFIIFSKTYLNKFDGLYDKTFLYVEETLLRFRCQRAGLKMFYLADITALHNESRTEKFIGGNLNARHLRRYMNNLDSLIVLREYLQSDNI